MNQLRGQSSTEYTIEVNDNGDTISMDIADPSFMSRLAKTLENMDRLSDEYKNKADEIEDGIAFESSPDENGNSIKISKKELGAAELLTEFYSKTRNLLDDFLGKGACQKIFGDKNWFTMFDDLIEQLQPHFKKMVVNAEKLKKSAVQKYAPNRETKRALK